MLAVLGFWGLLELGFGVRLARQAVKLLQSFPKAPGTSCSAARQVTWKFMESAAFRTTVVLQGALLTSMSMAVKRGGAKFS